MPVPPITLRRVLSRARRETFAVFSLDKPDKLAAKLLLGGLGLYATYLVAGLAPMRNQLGHGIATVVVLAVAVAAWFAVNVVLTVFRLPREDAAEVDRLRAESEQREAAARRELAAIKAAKPNASVYVQSEGEDWYLQVHNLGGNATFRAEIRVVKREFFPGAVEGRTYSGYWERTRKSDSDIHTGHRDRILIGRVESQRGWIAVSLLFTGRYADPEFTKQPWPPVSDPPLPKPVLWLVVTLSAEPAMEKPLLLGYTLGIDGVKPFHIITDVEPE